MRNYRQFLHLGGVFPNSVVQLQITLTCVRRDYLLKHNLQIRNFFLYYKLILKGDHI